MLGIVLDPGARELNKIDENHSLADILDVTQRHGSRGRVMWARQEGLEAQPGWPGRGPLGAGLEQCRTTGRRRALGAHGAASVAGVGGGRELKVQRRRGLRHGALRVLGALGHVFVPSETLLKV